MTMQTLAATFSIQIIKDRLVALRAFPRTNSSLQTLTNSTKLTRQPLLDGWTSLNAFQTQSSGSWSTQLMRRLTYKKKLSVAVWTPRDSCSQPKPQKTCTLTGVSWLTWPWIMPSQMGTQQLAIYFGVDCRFWPIRIQRICRPEWLLASAKL